jgi:hypothetical protein
MNLLRSQHRQAMALIVLVSCVWTMTLHAQQPGTAFIFYSQPQVSADLWPSLFQIVHADLEDEAELPSSLVSDRAVTLVRASDDLKGVSFGRIISVKLLGRCDVLPQANRPTLQGPLGWVWLISGTIEPFVSIDCTRLAQVLRPAVAGLNKQERQYAMNQAIAHVLIHEWSHIALQNRSHTAHGLTQADLSANELIRTPRSNPLSAVSRGLQSCENSGGGATRCGALESLPRLPTSDFMSNNR